MDDEFIKCVSIYKKNKKSMPIEYLFEFQALYKQITIGPCNISCPPAKFKPTNFWRMLFGIPTKFDFTEVDKWQIWKNLGDLSKEESMKKYISLIKSRY
jgi:acyl-CoA-binding protein